MDLQISRTERNSKRSGRVETVPVVIMDWLNYRIMVSIMSTFQLTYVIYSRLFGITKDMTNADAKCRYEGRCRISYRYYQPLENPKNQEGSKLFQNGFTPKNIHWVSTKLRTQYPKVFIELRIEGRGLSHNSVSQYDRCKRLLVVLPCLPSMLSASCCKR
jgi:hypothetical protein